MNDNIDTFPTNQMIVTILNQNKKIESNEQKDLISEKINTKKGELVFDNLVNEYDL